MHPPGQHIPPGPKRGLSWITTTLRPRGTAFSDPCDWGIPGTSMETSTARLVGSWVRLCATQSIRSGLQAALISGDDVADTVAALVLRDP